MKQLIIILFSFSMAVTASAQRYDNKPYSRGGYDAPVSRGRYMANDAERRIYEINREYDNKIWSVKHTPHLRGREERGIVKQLEYERAEQIREVRRWAAGRPVRSGANVSVRFR